MASENENSNQSIRPKSEISSTGLSDPYCSLQRVQIIRYGYSLTRSEGFNLEPLFRTGPTATGGGAFFFDVGDMRALAAPPPAVALWHGAAAPPAGAYREPER